MTREALEKLGWKFDYRDDSLWVSRPDNSPWAVVAMEESGVDAFLASEQFQGGVIRYYKEADAFIMAFETVARRFR